MPLLSAQPGSSTTPEGSDGAIRCRPPSTTCKIEAVYWLLPASPVAAVVTLSAGVACLVPDERNSPEALLALADANLYRAKSAGRDRVDQGVETLQLQ